MGIAEHPKTNTMHHKQAVSTLLGVGLYPIAEAASYTGIKPVDIRRWLFGYTLKNKHYPGLWQPELGATGEPALGFRDLLEIRFIAAFRKHEVSLQAIRLAVQHARELFQQDYPFTCKRFQTDGRSIFATVQEETGDESLLDLVRRQQVFRQVISPSLYEGIEYESEGSLALRWHPLKGSKAVVLDPARHFGKPILTKSGISTETIALSFAAEARDARRVASLFDISLQEVEAALRYEEKLAA